MWYSVLNNTRVCSGWCRVLTNTRGCSGWCSASTFTREAAVPRIIPGGVASQPLAGRQLYQGGVKDLLLFITGHDPCLYQSLVYNNGGSLFTPVASWGRALGRSVNPRGAIATSLAGLAPVQVRSLWLEFLHQPDLYDVQHRGWPGPSIEGSSFW